MKNVLVFAVLFFGIIQLHSQSISKQVIGSSGQSISNETHTLNFTIGESVVGLVQNGASIQQGFWAELFSDETLSVSTLNESLEQVQLFPNPVVSYLQINFKQNAPVDFEGNMFDINGKQVMNIQLKSVSNQLDVTSLSNGIYVLSIFSNATNYHKSFKIIKK